MPKILWTERALRYLKDEVRSNAKVRALVAAVDNLEHYPEMYPIARSRNFVGCRVISTVKPFAVVYRVTKSGAVEVLEIVDGRRNY